MAFSLPSISLPLWASVVNHQFQFGTNALANIPYPLATVSVSSPLTQPFRSKIFIPWQLKTCFACRVHPSNSLS
jgi:hypothetical protein